MRLQVTQLFLETKIWIKFNLIIIYFHTLCFIVIQFYFLEKNGTLTNHQRCKEYVSTGCTSQGLSTDRCVKDSGSYDRRAGGQNA
jgi:hypothetical protein